MEEITSAAVEIPGFEGLYAITRNGVVYSLPRSGRITGAITASGGSWNASIVSEYVSWGATTVQADGLGSYIAHMTAIGDFPRIALGIGVMCVFVMGLNHFVWRRLYRLAEDRMHF